MIKLKKIIQEDNFNISNKMEEFKKIVDNYDWTGHFSDDARYWKKQQEDKQKLSNLYKNMDDNERQEAYNYYQSKAKWDDIKDIEHFNKRMGVR